MREMRDHQRYRGEDLPRDLAAPGAGALLHGRGINLKAFDLALDFAGAAGVMRNVAGGPPEDMGLSVLPTRDGGLLLGFEVDARSKDQAAVDHLLSGLRALLSGLTDGLPVGRIALIDDVERLLADWCPPALPGTPVDVAGRLRRDGRHAAPATPPWSAAATGCPPPDWRTGCTSWPVPSGPAGSAPTTSWRWRCRARPTR